MLCITRMRTFAHLMILCGTFCSVVIGLTSVPSAAASPSVPAATEQTGTMSFRGVTDVAGLLSAVTVVPAQLRVVPEGTVAFVNDTEVSMMLAVGNSSVEFPAQQTRTFRFPGTSAERHVSARATAVNLPLLGALTSSVGTVTVAPQVSPDVEARATPSAGAAAPDGAAPSTPPATPSATAGSQPAAPGASPTPERSGAEQPTVAEPILIEPVERSERLADPNSSPSELASRGFAELAQPGNGRLGLAIVTATVLLIGVAMAVFRALFSYRALHRR